MGYKSAQIFSRLIMGIQIDPISPVHLKASAYKLPASEKSLWNIFFVANPWFDYDYDGRLTKIFSFPV